MFGFFVDVDWRDTLFKAKHQQQIQKIVIGVSQFDTLLNFYGLRV